ncbi:hypothetical protein CBR_g55390 [Chara braunii]|uniref:DUF659 domain-containing protein n=1 Tax=Chara braunii TaxID=69332 RepID=A0A388K7N9_CHABU|nr:hypothetical protein CBR_g55390 [Chara braunii]|eukprot:GBG66047.1 hypothetical protein CBR_g55390 [Chara braunii]
MSAKHLTEQIKLHFIVEGAAGKFAFKGSKHWKCKYCEHRFTGTATKLKDHFLDKCNLDYCMTKMPVEERARREEGIRQGKWVAHVLMYGEAGGSDPSNSRTAAAEVPEFPSSQAGATGITGETPTPHSTADTVLGSKSSKAVSRGPLRQTLIEEADNIGSDAVVGVVMDNAGVCVKAGKMVEAAYPNIFRVRCTAHALNLALEDMYKDMAWMAKVVNAGNRVGKFFTNVDKVRAMFNNYLPKTKLKRLTTTRFATNFEMLGSLKDLKNALDRCVCDAGWVDKMVQADQLVALNEVTTIILDKGKFLSNLNKALDVMKLVVELLRLVDGQGPTISKVYVKMNMVVQRIRALDCLSSEEHEAVECILINRWSFMASELHCVATFLDPEHRMHNAQRDPEVRAGFNIWLYSWMPRDKLKEVSFQVDQWVNGLGGLSTEQARDQASRQPPALWWEAFGSKHDLLAPQAIKLLGQANSSAACEWNWSLHELTCGRRRTKLMPERMAKLVYNNRNVRLLRSNQRGGGDDIHIPWADDVPVEKEMEEWYADWLKRVHGDVDEEEVVVVDVDDEEGEFPLRRTFQCNDEVEERLCDEEDSDLVGTRQRDWHECTKLGKYRERELRRRSGSELAVPPELYTVEGYAFAMAARQAGTWVKGRAEGPRSRRKNKGKEKDDGNTPVQRGKRNALEPEQPRPKRSRPTLAEQAERRAQKAIEKAAKAAADAAAAKAVAVKAVAHKAKAAVRADARNVVAGKTKRVAVINDDDDDDILEDIRGDEEPEGSTSTSSSSSSSLESSGRKGMKKGDDEGVGEGAADQEESGEEE